MKFLAIAINFNYESELIMNIFERIKYDLWPFLKTKLYFWWWVVKYKGKKNIPRDVIFAQMVKSLERMSQNLQCARASAMNDADTNKDEMREIYDAIKKAENLQQEIENIQKKQQLKFLAIAINFNCWS